MTVLIPFAMDAITGEICEVGEVPRGRSCGCVCLSCHSGMVARQGPKREWYFAHDSGAKNGPDRACDLSFYSACRLYIIDQLKRGRIRSVSVPPSGRSPRHSHSDRRQWTILDSLEFYDSQEFGDVKAAVGEYTLEIFLDYTGRRAIIEPKDRSKTAVLSVALQYVQSRFLQARSGENVLARIASDMFLEEGPHKAWFYHPNNRAIAGAARTAPLDAEVPQSFSLPSLAADGAGFACCYVCEIEWRCRKEESRICPRCKQGTTKFGARSWYSKT